MDIQEFLSKITGRSSKEHYLGRIVEDNAKTCTYNHYELRRLIFEQEQRIKKLESFIEKLGK